MKLSKGGEESWVEAGGGEDACRAVCGIMQPHLYSISAVGDSAAAQQQGDIVGVGGGCRSIFFGDSKKLSF